MSIEEEIAGLISFESQRTTEETYRAAMRKAARSLSDLARVSYIPNLRIARLYAHADEVETAFGWLECAFTQRESPLVHLAVTWDWDNMRRDARFASLLRRVDTSRERVGPGSVDTAAEIIANRIPGFTFAAGSKNQVTMP